MTSKAESGVPELSDEQLLHLVKEGREDAFDELFERYKAKIFSFIRRYVRENAAAEDIFQETFIRLYTKSGYYKGGSKFSTWLYTIAVNLCRDELRKRGRRKSVSLDGAGDFGKNGKNIPPAAEKVTDGKPGPRLEAEMNELSFLVREAVDELPEEFRTVMILHGLHRLKYREIAEVLGIPRGTVQSRMHTALNRLRARLKALKNSR